MKIFKITLLVLLFLIIISVIGVVIFIKTFDINRYKPQIIEQISQNLGRQVELDRIGLQFSLEKGVSLGLKGLSVVDDPQFSPEKFLKIDDISLGVDIMAYLKNKQISISTVVIKSPKIVVIRNKEGLMNVQQFTALKGPSSSPESAGTAGVAEPKPENKVSVQSLPALLVQSIEVEDALVTFIDRSFEPPLAVDISKIGLNIERFSLTQPFLFKVNAAVFSPAENIQIEGQAQLDIAQSRVLVKDLNVTSNLAKLDLNALQGSLAFLKGVSFPEKLSGNFKLATQELTLTPAGLVGLSAQGELKDGSVKLKELSLPLDSIQISFDLTDARLNVKSLSMALGQGKIQGTANINDYLGKQEFQFDLSAENIDLGEVINQKDQPIKLQGKMFGQMKGQGKGFDPAHVLTTLVSEGNMEIKEGRLTNINVLKTVLDKISMLPNLVERIEEKLPQRFKENLNQQDTILNKVQIETGIANHAIVLKSAQVDADGFLLAGNGQMGFDQTINLDTSLTMPEDLSASMVEAVGELQYLLGSDKEIQIPVRVSGQVPALSFSPDMEYLGKKIYQNKGKEELEKILDKVFGDGASGEGTTSPTGEDGQAGTPPEKEKSPERQIIENILDNIFKY